MRMWRNWNPVPYWFPVTSMEKGTLVPQKIKIRTTIQSSNSPLDIYPKELETGTWRDVWTQVYNNQKEKLSIHLQINNSKMCLIYTYTQWNIIQPLILLLLNIINIIHPLKGRKFWHMLQYERSLMISEISQSLKG